MALHTLLRCMRRTMYHSKHTKKSECLSLATSFHVLFSFTILFTFTKFTVNLWFIKFTTERPLAHTKLNVQPYFVVCFFAYFSALPVRQLFYHYIVCFTVIVAAAATAVTCKMKLDCCCGSLTPVWIISTSTVSVRPIQRTHDGQVSCHTQLKNICSFWLFHKSKRDMLLYGKCVNGKTSWSSSNIGKVANYTRKKKQNEVKKTRPIKQTNKQTNKRSTKYDACTFASTATTHCALFGV